MQQQLQHFHYNFLTIMYLCLVFSVKLIVSSGQQSDMILSKCFILYLSKASWYLWNQTNKFELTTDLKDYRLSLVYTCHLDSLLCVSTTCIFTVFYPLFRPTPKTSSIMIPPTSQQPELQIAEHTFELPKLKSVGVPLEAPIVDRSLLVSPFFH